MNLKRETYERKLKELEIMANDLDDLCEKERNLYYKEKLDRATGFLVDAMINIQMILDYEGD